MRQPWESLFNRNTREIKGKYLNGKLVNVYINMFMNRLSER